jgi:N-acetylglucosaminyl-diphospho-decaprenol L-rhamnosyltransferase
MQLGSNNRQRTPDLDVGVIYTGERQWMRRLLSTLRGSTGGLDVRVLLVDNCSRDGAEQWSRVFPKLDVISNQRRLYYAANLNRILEASTAPYVLLLNTDVYFDPEESCLSKMVSFMRCHPQCGIAGCRVHHEDGSYAFPARRFQTLPIIVSRRLGLARLMPGVIDHYFYREHGILDQWACDWLSGCFMLVRREAVAEVGPFDVRFPKYFEDVDMCLRMAQAGWLPMYNGQTYCYHLERRASKRLLSADALKHARSYLLWLRKWGFSPNAAPVAPQVRRAA